MANRKLERRFVAAQEIAPPATTDEGEVPLRGHALTWGEIAEPWPGLRESFEAGAFAEFLAGDPDVFACYQHDTTQLLGRTSSGTFRLSEDERGLAYELDLPDTTLGRDVRKLVERGDLRGVSICFHAEEEAFEELPEGALRRTIHRASLYEISIVTDPAYRNSTAGFRSAQEALQEIRDKAQAAQRAATQRRLKARLALIEVVGRKGTA